MKQVNSLRSILTLPLTLGWLALAVSSVGDAMLNFVFIIDAARHTRPLSIGILGFLIGTPVLLGGWVGAWIDAHREHTHRILVGSLAVSGVITIALWFVWSSSYVVAATYGVTFLLGLLNMVMTTTWQSSVPELVSRDDDDSVKRVMGWTVTTVTLGPALGPLAAAVTASVFGRDQLIMIDGLSFFFAAAAFLPAAARLAGTCAKAAGEPAVPAAARPARAGCFEGLRMIFAHPLIRVPALSLSVMNFIMFGMTFAIPLLVVQRGFPDGMVASVSAVLVIGGLIGSIIGTRFRQDRMFLAYLMAEPAMRGLGLVVIALSSSAVGILAGAALFTLPQGMGRVARVSNMATSFPRGERAKVFGSYQMLIRGFMPVAPLLMQPTVRMLGAVGFFFGSSALLCGLSLGIASDRSLRRASLARTAKPGEREPSPA
jgi:MFS family permease